MKRLILLMVCCGVLAADEKKDEKKPSRRAALEMTEVESLKMELVRVRRDLMNEQVNRLQRTFRDEYQRVVGEILLAHPGATLDPVSLTFTVPADAKKDKKDRDKKEDKKEEKK